jgi:hypothetical protein
MVEAMLLGGLRACEFIDGDRIVHIEMHADPDMITALWVQALEGRGEYRTPPPG